MEVQKCLEYYFERDATKEEIMKYIDKNIVELKKISKIKDIKIEIIQNEYEAQKATVILIVKKRGIKKKVVNQPKVKKQKLKKAQHINFKGGKLQKRILKFLNEKKKKQEEKKESKLIQKQEKCKIQEEKYEYEKIEKKEEIQTRPIIKIETEMPIKKYGEYKEGGKFAPYQEKKKGKVEIWKNKLKKLNKNH